MSKTRKKQNSIISVTYQAISHSESHLNDLLRYLSDELKSKKNIGVKEKTPKEVVHNVSRCKKEGK